MLLLCESESATKRTQVCQQYKRTRHLYISHNEHAEINILRKHSIMMTNGAHTYMQTCTHIFKHVQDTVLEC